MTERIRPCCRVLRCSHRSIEAILRIADFAGFLAKDILEFSLMEESALSRIIPVSDLHPD